MKKAFLAVPLLSLLLFMFVNTTPSFASPISTGNVSSYTSTHACDQTPKGFAHCLAIVRKPVGASPNKFTSTPAGLLPKDLQSAYNLPSSTAGKGQTVAVIDANDDPNAEQDMAAYRKAFGLPACTTANKCFKKVDQNGGTNYPVADSGWAGEIALDLDMVSAIAPNSNILLIEATTASYSNLGQSVDTAVRLGAKIVTNSYGGQEDQSSVSRIAHYYNHPGVTIVASAGDSGYGVQLPAAYNTVIAVGGTSLSRASNARGWNESTWNGTGSGCSQYVSKPKWQKDSSCKQRTIADVSAVANPDTGVAVYNTYDSNGTWFIYGGTSVSSPIIAGVYALAGNAAKVDASYLYQHSSNFYDIAIGNNGTCKPGYFCTAGKGYDGPTGLGTPHGITAF